jgi:hypothetical protein
MPGIAAAELVAGAVLGSAALRDSIRVSPGLILLEAGFEVHPAWKMAATGSWRIRRSRGVGHGCG